MSKFRNLVFYEGLHYINRFVFLYNGNIWTDPGE